MSTIAETAVAAGSFNTLVAAAKAANLIDTLSSPGPFTVFAPNDEAFAKLPLETLKALLEPEAKDQLVGILTYHVVPGRVTASEVAKLSSVTTVQGQNITIDISNGVKVNGVNVVKTDIECDNGIIHVIDGVILPN